MTGLLGYSPEAMFYKVGSQGASRMCVIVGVYFGCVPVGALHPASIL